MSDELAGSDTQDLATRVADLDVRVARLEQRVSGCIDTLVVMAVVALGVVGCAAFVLFVLVPYLEAR